jgi:integrase
MTRDPHSVCSSFLAHHCPSVAHHGNDVAMDAAKGSIRQRGSNSYELRVYAGTDPSTGRLRWLTRTVHGDRTDARRELKAFAAHANVAPAVGARTTIGELLDLWFAHGRARWSPTTIRNLQSIVDCHLKPGFGNLLVGDLTTVMVDAFYERLRTDGRTDGKPLAVGTVRRVHSVLHAALAQAQRWSWVFDNVAVVLTRLHAHPIVDISPRKGVSVGSPVAVSRGVPA